MGIGRTTKTPSVWLNSSMNAGTVNMKCSQKEAKDFSHFADLNLLGFAHTKPL